MSVFGSGLEDLRAALRNLPAELAAEAEHVVEGAANGAAAAIKGAYPRRSGDLDDHVSVDLQRTPFGVVGIVRNTSKLARIFEYGTQARHNALGANRGAMPPGRVFIPNISAARRRMVDDLIAIVQRAGLEVTGDA